MTRCERLGKGISIHALREEGDLTTDTELRQTVISIHALREEGDRRSHRRGVVDQQISIHALREEGDGSFSQFILDLDTFLSTPSARRATHPLFASQSFLDISIHALREEGDCCAVTAQRHNRLFLSTPSARRATFIRYSPPRAFLIFLSTPSARRATYRVVWTDERRRNFYPRPPRGGRRPQSDAGQGVRRFLSTPSARRATQNRRLQV